MKRYRLLIVLILLVFVGSLALVAVAGSPWGSATARYGEGVKPPDAQGNGPNWTGQPGIAKNGGGGQTGTKPGANWPGPSPGQGAVIAKNGGGGQTGTKPGANWPGPPPGQAI